ncbi:unnamed protein product [Urochloa humidicola]
MRRDDDDDHSPSPGLHAGKGVYCLRLPGDKELNSMSMADLQHKFAAHASALRTSLEWLMASKVRGERAQANPSLQERVHMTSAHEYIDRARRFAMRLGLHGDAAWSGLTAGGVAAEVPVTRAFTTIRSSLGSPTVQEVEAALDAFVLFSAAGETEPGAPTGAATPDNAGGTRQDGVGDVGLDCDGPLAPSPDGQVDHCSGPPDDGPGAGQPRTAEAQCEGRDALPAQHDAEEDGSPDGFGIDELFRLLKAVLNAPPARRPRQRRTFDMSAEFIAMFAGPLREHIIAALTTIFDLEEEGAELLNEVLLEHAGEGIHDLQDEAGPLAA